MSPRTIFLSRLLGLYCLLAGLSMVVHKQATVGTVSALIHNPPALYIAGVFALACGLAMVLAHNIWSGGVLPVVVTLAGWLAFIKGLLLLFLSSEATVCFFTRIHYGRFFYLFAVIPLLLGAYLTYGGFKSRSH